LRLSTGAPFLYRSEENDPRQNPASDNPVDYSAMLHFASCREFNLVQEDESHGIRDHGCGVWMLDRRAVGIALRQY
jgi:hypothetical protein